jgi:hypothetical protein
MVHCEQCGAEASAESGAVNYCLQCGRYVCARCWSPRDFCTTCSPGPSRRTFAGDLRLMRRVDRRLRELMREAPAILARIGEGHEISEVSFDALCMRLKARSAERGRAWILQHERRRSSQRALLTPLASRVNRHALGVWAIGEEVAEALQAATERVAIAKPRQESVFSSWLMGRSGIALAVAGASAAVAVAVVLGPSPPRMVGEGVLGGGPDTPPAASVAPSAAAAPPRSPGPSPVTVAVSFDDARIGSSWGLIQGSGSVGVVAFPTAFDRSVEVLTEDGAPVETCLAFDSAMAVVALEVDAYFEEAGDVAGSVSLLDGMDRPLIEVALRADESVATVGGGALAVARGVEARAWYRVRLAERTGRVDFSVDRLADGVFRLTKATLLVDSLGSANRVCLGVFGEPGAAAYYDNLRVMNRSNTGG